jgi:MYXO-CTERM domain-containing protein
MARRLGWVLPSLLAVAGDCDPGVPTEFHQLQLSTSLQSYAAYAGPLVVVEGSTVCLEYDGYRASTAEPPEYEDAEPEALAACYDERVTGPATVTDEGCTHLDAAGSVTWSFTRRDCALDGDFGDDEVRIESIAFADTRGAFSEAVDNQLDYEALGVEARGFSATPPEGVVAEVGAPIYVIDNGLESIFTAIVRRNNPTQVAVSDAWATGTVIEGSPSFPDANDPKFSLAVDARAGDVFSVTLHLPAGELEAGEVHVVSEADIASLELFPDEVRFVDTDAFLARGATAVARDDMGRVLRGPLVTWAVVDGDVELEEFDNDKDGVPDPGAHVDILNACEGAAAGEQRSATLEGRLGTFVETVQVDWECVESSDDEGCACRARPGSSGLAWMFGVVILGATRRRRP